jgi:hypothetical protein
VARETYDGVLSIVLSAEGGSSAGADTKGARTAVGHEQTKKGQESRTTMVPQAPTSAAGNGELPVYEQLACKEQQPLADRLVEDRLRKRTKRAKSGSESEG